MAASPTAIAFEPGRYTVVIDTAFVRQGPGLRFPIAADGGGQFSYNTELEFDQIVAGDAVKGIAQWGHLATGLGFVSLTAVRGGQPDVQPAAAQPVAGPYHVVVDRAPIREAPELSGQIAAGGTAYAEYNIALDFDQIIQGEPINGNAWWGHLSNSMGFVALIEVSPGSNTGNIQNDSSSNLTPTDQPSEPTGPTTLTSTSPPTEIPRPARTVIPRNPGRQATDVPVTDEPAPVRTVIPRNPGRPPIEEPAPVRTVIPRNPGRPPIDQPPIEIVPPAQPVVPRNPGRPRLVPTPSE